MYIVVANDSAKTKFTNTSSIISITIVMSYTFTSHMHLSPTNVVGNFQVVLLIIEEVFVNLNNFGKLIHSLSSQIFQ